MDTQDAIGALGDPGLCEVAHARLAAQGRAAVGPLIRALLTTDSLQVRARIDGLLNRDIGPDLAFDDVLEALAAAPDETSRRRLGSTFTAFHSVDRFVDALRHRPRPSAARPPPGSSRSAWWPSGARRGPASTMSG